MYLAQHNATYPVSTRQSAFPAGAVAAMGLAGALIAGSAAAARDMRLVKANEMSGPEAAGDVVKEALGGALATAAGAAAAGTFFRSGPLALAAMAVVGAGVKYLYDGMTDRARPSAEKALIAKPAPKAASSKTAKKS